MGETADELRRTAQDGAAAGQDTEAATPEAETIVIRQEIEQTRADMGETIDAIQKKLSPEVLAEQAKEAAQDAAAQAVEQAKEAVREATIGKAENVVRNVTDTAQGVMQSADEATGGTGSTIMETIRKNPLPAALTGIGLAWLWMSRERQPADGWSGTRGWSSSAGASGRYQGGRIAVGSAWDQGLSGYTGSRDRYVASVGSQEHGVGGPIERARDAAGEAIEGAQETLGYAADRAQGAVRTAGSAADGVGATIVDMIKQNPIPAALAGASLAWLWMNRPAGDDWTRQRGFSSAYGSQHGGRDRGVVGQTQASASQMAGQVQETAGQIAGQVQETAGQWAGQVQETAGQVADQAQYRVSDARGRFDTMLRENPLAIGAAALALGALAGASVPQTAQEHQMLGEARDTLVDRAQEMVHETADKVQRVAGSITETAKDEARDQGLMQ